ncbi:MAG: hypothetical protein PXY39_12610 [archaeon]|nr:hypothetical protein [archaeon]
MQTNSYVRGIGILVISLGSWFELLVMGVTPSWLLAEEACLALVVTGGILVLLSFYITENESAIWSVQSKIAKTIRMGVASFLFSFLFVFFLPLVPFKIAVPPCIVSGFGCPEMSGSYYTGYNSIGSEIFKWGASWQNLGQYYVPPAISYNMSELTAMGALFFIALPAILAGVWTISPEIIGGVHDLKLGVKAIVARAQDFLDIKRGENRKRKVLPKPNKARGGTAPIGSSKKADI